MGLYVLTFCRREYGADGNMAPPPQYRFLPRRNISIGCAKLVGVLCLTTDKRGPKLDMLNYTSTYIPRVSFVEETANHR